MPSATCVWDPWENKILPEGTSKSGAEPASADNLGQRSAVAFGWGVFASIAKILMTIVVQAVLARLLGPTEFGLYALGMLVMGVATYFADVGLATSLVQKGEVTATDIRFVLTLNLCTSGAVAGAVVLCADLLAAAFDKPQTAPILRALAPVFVMNAVASVSISLLRRRLDYRTIQIAGLVGYFVGFGIVGIAFAALVGSVYALVIAYCVQSAITLSLLYAKVRHVVGLSFSGDSRRSHLSFGGTVLATTLVNWLVDAMDRVVVGRLFSSASLGQYSAAQILIQGPINALSWNLQSTVFSLAARMQGEPERMRYVYLELLNAVTVIFIPLFAGVFFFAPTLVVVIYGPNWSIAARVAQAFCVMVPFLVVWAISTPILWNTGRRSAEFAVQLPFIPIAALAIVVAAGDSLLAVAWVTAAMFVLRTLLMVILACRALDISLAVATRRILPSVWITALVGLVAMACAHMLRAIGTTNLVSLLLGGASIGVAVVACLSAAPDSLPFVVRRYAGRWSKECPPGIRGILNRLSHGAS